MLKKAMEFVVELARPNVQEIGGEVYSDKSLYRIDHNPKAATIELTTLSSFLDYIKSGVDKTSENMIVHVVSPTKVCMYSALDSDRKREYTVDVKAQIPSFEFGRFIDHESFCIGLQSKFLDDPHTDRALLLKFAGTVESGTVAQYGDDGITQKATVKTGLASKSDAIVPNPVTLRPFRTFIEVQQPASRFVFRMSDKNSVQCALFEADGGAWKMDAMQSIKEYLEAQLQDVPGYIVIC